MNKDKIQLWSLRLGFSCIFTFTALGLWNILAAFFNPSHTIVIYTNMYGESTIEFVLLLILSPFMFYSLVYTLTHLWELKKKAYPKKGKDKGE